MRVRMKMCSVMTLLVAGLAGCGETADEAAAPPVPGTSGAAVEATPDADPDAAAAASDAAFRYVGLRPDSSVWTERLPVEEGYVGVQLIFFGSAQGGDLVLSDVNGNEKQCASFPIGFEPPALGAPSSPSGAFVPEGIEHYQIVRCPLASGVATTPGSEIGKLITDNGQVPIDVREPAFDLRAEVTRNFIRASGTSVKLVAGDTNSNTGDTAQLTVTVGKPVFENAVNGLRATVPFSVRNDSKLERTIRHLPVGYLTTDREAAGLEAGGRGGFPLNEVTFSPEEQLDLSAAGEWSNQAGKPAELRLYFLSANFLTDEEAGAAPDDYSAAFDGCSPGCQGIVFTFPAS